MFPRTASRLTLLGTFAVAAPILGPGAACADEQPASPPAEATAEASAEAPALAEPLPEPPFGTLGDGSPPDSFFDALASGKVDLNMRLRYEYADTRGLDVSNAVTLRTRLGYGTAEYQGLSFYVDFEDVRAFDDEAYDPNRIEPIPPRTFISDPEGTELNQAFIKYNFQDLNIEVVGGRQRIILDDARFIGNVGWRQNEQTFDAIQLKTDFNIEGLSAYYAYIWDVNRIFGDREQDGVGPPPGSLTRDFESDSHAINVSYDKLAVGDFEIGKLTGFAYLLDLERKGDGVAVFSTNTVGLLLNGKQKVNDDLTLGYKLSYAYQTDTGNNPRSLEADYYLAEGTANISGFGTIVAGYEVLGADGNTQAFSTPLATLHKFQGWSDVLLVPSLTGGPIGSGAGIRDLYVGYVNKKLPGGLVGKAYYHLFETDSGGVDIGQEFNAVLVKKVNNNLTILAKYAHFEADDVFADTDRFWLEATFKF